MILSDHPQLSKNRAPWKSKPKWSDLRVFFIGGYCIGENDHVRLWLQSLKDLGANVYEFSTEDHPEVLDWKGRPHDYGTFGPVYLNAEKLRPLIDGFNPHWIFCCAGGLSFTPYESALLRRKYCLTGMALSDPDVFLQTTQHIFRNFDVYFTNSRAAADLYRILGPNVHWFGFSCYPPYHRRVPSSPEFACQVLFVGEARPDRVELVNRVASLFDTKVFGARWDQYAVPSKGFLSAQDFITAANSAVVCVDFARNRAGDLMVKHRIFELAACGAIICTEYFEDLALYFQYGKEILRYDTIDQLIAQIRLCVSDPKFREAIGDSAYRRAHSDHTFAHRWKELAHACGIALN